MMTSEPEIPPWDVHVLSGTACEHERCGGTIQYCCSTMGPNALSGRGDEGIKCFATRRRNYPAAENYLYWYLTRRNEMNTVKEEKIRGGGRGPSGPDWRCPPNTPYSTSGLVPYCAIFHTGVSLDVLRGCYSDLRLVGFGGRANRTLPSQPRYPFFTSAAKELRRNRADDLGVWGRVPPVGEANGTAYPMARGG
jgi:hypothetical protein